MTECARVILCDPNAPPGGRAGRAEAVRDTVDMSGTADAADDPTSERRRALAVQTWRGAGALGAGGADTLGKSGAPDQPGERGESDERGESSERGPKTRGPARRRRRKAGRERRDAAAGRAGRSVAVTVRGGDCVPPPHAGQGVRTQNSGAYRFEVTA
ncbi:hypothetical protein GCM10007977_070120 [Dactylosporangium sucinum]|uniref:Uncharacterized protein n=1 Tax=Dactylosporangium sucinum TaxID=1424081 RepID=A0A917U543_9ACTN|nr:hypothetical protein GCM10007977_070120 [Dactylosporangium sucinum]